MDTFILQYTDENVKEISQKPFAVKFSPDKFPSISKVRRIKAVEKITDERKKTELSENEDYFV